MSSVDGVGVGGQLQKGGAATARERSRLASNRGAVDRCDDDRRLLFRWHSRIPHGGVATLYVDCDLRAAREKRTGARNDAFADRRPDRYSESCSGAERISLAGPGDAAEKVVASPPQTTSTLEGGSYG
jgi:hypothetical protein